MSVKECDHHNDKKKKLWICILVGSVIIILILVIIFLIIWPALKPNKPTFILLDATIYAFNLSPVNLLTSTFQVTVQSRNPNSHHGVYYDRLLIYATYRDQQISLPTSFPTTYQDTNGKNTWSPFVMGVSVPIAPFTGEALNEDRTTERLLINFKMDGRMRWKVGTFVSRSYHVHVDCPAVIAVGSPNAGIAVGPSAVKYQLMQSCSVSV